MKSGFFYNFNGTVYGFDTMSDDELVSLENEVNSEAKLTKEDCVYWAATGFWKLDEAASLIHSRDRRRLKFLGPGLSWRGKTTEAKIFQIMDAYARCITIGEFSPRTVLDQEALDHGIERHKIVVVPKDFLLWAKSKGLPIPPTLWSAVFTPEAFALEFHGDCNIERSLVSPTSSPPAGIIGKDTGSGQSKAPSKNMTKKDPDCQKNGGNNYKGLTEFRRRVRQFILDEKDRGCTCNHLRLAAFFINVWDSQKKKLFIDGEGNKLWEIGKHKEPTTYFVEICRKTYADCHKNISQEEKEKKWRIVKRMNIDSPKTSSCPIPQHNNF